MSSTATTPRVTSAPLNERLRDSLNALNLHLAGVALLALVNVYLLVQLVFLWQKASSNDPQAVAQQQIALKTAEVGAEPLRGLDSKLTQATQQSDTFYRQRLPGSDSEVLTELGAITKSHNVRLTRGQYLHAPVLAGTPGELTEMRIDASLSGDYRPLVQVINALERDRMFFIIDAVTLTGQQSGTVNLRLRLRTFLRGHVAVDDSAAAEQSASASTAPAAQGGQP